MTTCTHCTTPGNVLMLDEDGTLLCFICGHGPDSPKRCLECKCVGGCEGHPIRRTDRKFWCECRELSEVTG